MRPAASPWSPWAARLLTVIVKGSIIPGVDLSLSEAARLLGKSDRQLRYLIAKGEIRARKVGRQWRLRRRDLPLSKGQEKAAAQKEDRALKLEAAATAGRQLSVRKIRACQVGLPLYRELRDAVGDDHPAVALLHEALLLVACGYYEFHGREKSQYYSRAREQASRAAMTLLLQGETGGGQLVERFETSLLPAIGGLVRRAERRETRR